MSGSPDTGAATVRGRDALPRPARLCAGSPHAQAALVLFVSLVPFALLTLRFNYLCDDAFISFRYAQNFARGLGLHYNSGLGPPVEGYSEFLWVLWLALLDRLGADIIVWSRLTSGACGAILVGWLAVFLQRRLMLTLPWAAVCGVFVGCLPPLALWSTGGLATMPFTLAIFALYERLLGGETPRAWTAGLVAAAALLLRADGLYFVAAVFLVATATALRGRDARLLRATATAAALCFAIAALHIGWRLGYYGDYLPNTARAKVAMTPDTLWRGGRYVVSFVLTFPSVAIAILLPACFVLRSRYRVLAVQAWAITAATLIYAVAVGGDFMAMGRFLVPAIPFVCILFAIAIEALPGRLPHGATLAAAVAAACIAMSVLPAFDRHIVPTSVRARFQFRSPVKRPASELAQWKGMKESTESRRLVGLALKRHSKPGDSIAIAAIGVVGYYSDLTIFDACGLVDPAVARLPADARRRLPGHSRCVSPQYFLSQHPTFLQAAVEPRSEVSHYAGYVPEYRQEIIPLSSSEGFPEGWVLTVIRRVS